MKADQPEIAMGLLDTKTRNKLPDSAFAGPDRTFPVPDRSHAANAKARAAQGVKAGTITKSTQQKVNAAANKVLKKGKK